MLLFDESTGAGEVVADVINCVYVYRCNGVYWSVAGLRVYSEYLEASCYMCIVCGPTAICVSFAGLLLYVYHLRAYCYMCIVAGLLLYVYHCGPTARCVLNGGLRLTAH